MTGKGGDDKIITIDCEDPEEPSLHQRSRLNLQALFSSPLSAHVFLSGPTQSGGAGCAWASAPLGFPARSALLLAEGLLCGCQDAGV